MTTPPRPPSSSPLDMTPGAAADLLAQASRLAVEHVDTIPGARVAPEDLDVGEIRRWLDAYDFDGATAPDEALADVTARLRQWGVHPTHPGYFGLFNPAPTWPSVAADLIAAAINPQLAAHSHAPAAAEIDRHVLRFMASRLGLPAGTLGTFTSGGAEANHTAMVVALTARFASFGDEGLAAIGARPVCYASAESHLAWVKIAHACGLGRDAVRLVAVDAEQRMDLAALRATYEADVAAGRAPFLVIGTAGTTGAGALDPLVELADTARRWDLHFHVDAAWAGAAALSDALRPLLAGIELADTVTVDAHKWLSVPMAAGMVLCADPEPLREAFRITTSYMPAAADVGDDPYVIGMQWSRRAIGLKVFLSLATFGRHGYAAQLERDTALGRRIADAAVADGWVRVNASPLPVICLADPEADGAGSEASWAWHAAVAAHVVHRGNAWISPVRLAGRAAVRICVTNHRTTADDADALVRALAAARRAVDRAPERS
jgi:aromatic-L-amino-acid/L-tryptophan decarboxylase